MIMKKVLNNIVNDKEIIKHFVLLELDIMSKNSGKSHSELVELFKKDKEFANFVVKKGKEMAKELIDELDKAA